MSPTSTLCQKTREFLGMSLYLSSPDCLCHSLFSYPVKVSSHCLLKRLCSPVAISDGHCYRMKVWCYLSALDYFFLLGQINNITRHGWLIQALVLISCSFQSCYWMSMRGIHWNWRYLQPVISISWNSQRKLVQMVKPEQTKPTRSILIHPIGSIMNTKIRGTAWITPVSMAFSKVVVGSIFFSASHMESNSQKP